MEVSTDPDCSNHLCIICNKECHEKQKNPPEDNCKEFEENAKAWKEYLEMYIRMSIGNMVLWDSVGIRIVNGK